MSASMADQSDYLTGRVLPNDRRRFDLDCFRFVPTFRASPNERNRADLEIRLATFFMAAGLPCRLASRVPHHQSAHLRPVHSARNFSAATMRRQKKPRRDAGHRRGPSQHFRPPSEGRTGNRRYRAGPLAAGRAFEAVCSVLLVVPKSMMATRNALATKVMMPHGMLCSWSSGSCMETSCVAKSNPGSGCWFQQREPRQVENPARV